MQGNEAEAVRSPTVEQTRVVDAEAPRHIDKIVSGLLVTWIAFIGADRINLAAGAVGFIVTPFLAITPLILAAEAVRLGSRKGVMRIPSNTVPYCLLATAFLCIVGVSAGLSLDPVMSGRRAVLLAVQVYGSLLAALVLLNQRKPVEILVRGTYLGLVAATVFSVLQVYIWATDGWNSGVVETELFINLAPRTYGTLIPRLSGATIDQGRAGLIYLIQSYILFRFASPSKRRTLMLLVGGASLLGTLARSAILGTLATIAVHSILKGVRLTRGKILAVCGLVAAAAGLLLLLPATLEFLAPVLEPLAGRFSGEEESANIHFALIEHGLLLATSSFRNALFGVGFGNGWLVLAEFFPGDRYANFHSLYVTLLAEAGVIALLLALILLLYPFLVPPGPFVPLIAGTMAFNVFYQSISEPAFWLVVCLGWLTAGMLQRLPPRARSGPRENGSPHPTSRYVSLSTTPATDT